MPETQDGKEELDDRPDGKPGWHDTGANAVSWGLKVTLAMSVLGLGAMGVLVVFYSFMNLRWVATLADAVAVSALVLAIV